MQNRKGPFPAMTPAHPELRAREPQSLPALVSVTYLLQVILLTSHTLQAQLYSHISSPLMSLNFLKKMTGIYSELLGLCCELSWAGVCNCGRAFSSAPKAGDQGSHPIELSLPLVFFIHSLIGSLSRFSDRMTELCELLHAYSILAPGSQSGSRGRDSFRSPRQLFS